MNTRTLDLHLAADELVQERGGQLYQRLRLEQAIGMIIPVLERLERRARGYRILYRLFLRGLIAALEEWVRNEHEQAERLERLGLATR